MVDEDGSGAALEKDNAKTIFFLRVMDGCAAPAKPSKRFEAKLETRYEDSTLVHDEKKGETAFTFSEGMVAFKERTASGATLDGLLENLTTLEPLPPSEILAPYLDRVSGGTFSFRVLVGSENLMEALKDNMWIAKVLFMETGSLGAAEMGMLSNATLDFGENAWVISPAGVLLAGEIEDPMHCVYLIAQTMVGVATHMAIAEELKQQLYETPPTFTEGELTTYEGKLERISDTVSYVINDVRDEMLNADPRTVLIIRKLHEAMSIEAHESRVKVFMDVAKRKVERARVIKASREAKRLSAILFAFSMIIAFSNSFVIYVNLTKNLEPGLSPVQALLVEMPLFIITVLLVVAMFREIFTRTLKL